MHLLLLRCGDRAVAGDVIVGGDLAHPGVEQLPDLGHQLTGLRVLDPAKAIIGISGCVRMCAL